MPNYESAQCDVSITSRNPNKMAGLKDAVRVRLNKDPSMKISTYFSNLKWLVITFPLLFRRVDNWSRVFLYCLQPLHKGPLTIRFRNRDVLIVPKWYIFEGVAETLLQNVYHFDESLDNVVVDIGASIGDFTLFASRPKNVRVYSYDPDQTTFPYLQQNVAANRRATVRMFNRPASADSLQEIFQLYGEAEVDLLKIDCEGCEYELLFKCPSTLLSRVRKISMEIHPVKGRSKEELVRLLQGAGFSTSQAKEFGQGPYIYAWRD